MDENSRDEVAEHFEAYRQELLGFLRSRVSSAEHAEDLLQQVFLKLMNRSDLNAIDNPQAYLRTMARHVVADFYRHQNARDHGIVLDFTEVQHADESWSPGSSLRSRDLLEKFGGVLESLSPQVRNAFVLSRVYGYTYAEIGEALSISPRTVEKHVAKGLARCYESMFVEDDSQDVVNGSVKRG